MVFMSDGTSRPEGLWRYDASATAWIQVENDGSAGINFVDNDDFETDTTGYATYADAAGVNAVDGTGGVATTTFTRNTTTPLRGTGDGLITKDAANRQGEGVSYDFTIDEADKASMLKIAFDYKTSTAYADGDIRVQIYDVTNTNLIRIAPEDLAANEVNGKFFSSFQAAADSTSYRLILHISSTNASAYTVNIDNVEVTPAVSSRYTPVSDSRTQNTITIEGVTTDPTFGTISKQDILYRRVGDRLEATYSFDTDGTGSSAGSGTYLISLPTGLSFDSDKVTYSTSENEFNPHTNIGFGNLYNQAAGGIHGMVMAVPYDDTRFYLVSSSVVTDAGAASSETADTWGSASAHNATTRPSFVLQINVPIKGWSTGLSVEESLSGRIIAASIQGTDSNTVGAGTAEFVGYQTTLFDTHGGFTIGSTDPTESNSTYYTIPETGYYQVDAGIAFAASTGWTSNASAEIYIIKNGSTVLRRRGHLENNTTSHPVQTQISDTFYLEKGDTVSVKAYNGTAGALGFYTPVPRDTYFSIAKVQAPSEVLPSEKIYATYSHNAATSLTAATNTTIPYNTKETDSHNSVSSGVFTAPRSGMFYYSFTTYFATNSWAADKNIDTVVYKNGNVTTQVQTSRWISGGLASNTIQVPILSGLVYLTKGETLEFTVNHDNGGGNTTGTDATRNKMVIYSID